MNKFKSRISITFIAMLIILSTIGACYAVAERLGEMIIESTHIHSYPNGSYIPYSDLNDYYDVFCCQKGTSLPSHSQTELVGTNGDNLGVSYPYLTNNDLGMEILRQSSTSGSPFGSSRYTNRTFGRYKIESTDIATPKEAYILSEMIKVDGMGEYNYAQLAWWTTEAGSLGNTVAENAFAKEAEAFEAYILEAAGVNSTDELKYKTAEFTTPDGEQKKIENAFDFDYDPKWVTEGEYQTPTVVWDSGLQQYIIGPFAIDYVGSTEQFGDREEVQFAGITDMEIYTDDSEAALVLGKDWEFVWTDGERTQDTDSKFPLANEKFYIRLNYRENATKITNIKTKFRYMNAAGVFQNLRGTYFEAIWNQKSKDYYNTWTDSEGHSHSEYDHTDYWLKLTGLKEHTSQALALGINACRWYEYVEIDRRLDIRSGKIRIEKEVVDEDGEEVKDVNKFFYFRVNVDGAINGDSEIIKVKAGRSATTKTYYWNAEDGNPTYTVEEIDKDGFKQLDLENASGELRDGRTVKVKATNIGEHTGNLKIVKKIDKNILNGKESNLEGKTFNFKVTLSGTFKYNGQKYNDASTTIDASITINNGRGEWNLGNVKWYGETAPKYKVEELSSEFAELISITPSSGRLSEDETVTVTAINEQKIEKAKIHIIKTLENAELYSEEEIMKLKFNFEISVDGYDKQRIEISPIRKDNSYVWEYTSGYYEWFAGNNPNYTITEVDNPEGTSFVTATSDDVQITVNGQTITGTLVSDETKDFEVTNNIVNRIEKPHSGRIEITKHIDSDTLVDKEFKFVVTVTSKGSFTYKGQTYGPGTKIQLTNDSAVEITNDIYDENSFVVIKVSSVDAPTVWTSDEFTWNGEMAPEYTVEENLLAEDIASSVEPSKGTLADVSEGTNTVKVTAWNRDITPKAGYLHIIKTLENAQGMSTEYINSLVFKFQITVDGYEPYVVSLNAEKKGDSYVWEYTSNAFTWAADAEAPNYTITEIDLPEGTEFVSATSDGGTQIENGIQGKLKESQTGEILITTDNEFVNKANENSGNLIVKKQVTHESLNGQEFKFKVTIRGAFEYNGTKYGPGEAAGEEFSQEITVSGGSQWDSGTIKWYGNSAPTYTVEELESEIANNISVLNASGTIKPGAEATIATFINEPKLTGGYLEITKLVENGVIGDEEFTFRVTVDGYEPFIVTIKANQTYKSDMFKWYVTEEAPSYKVEEINLPEGTEVVRIDNAEGKLAPEGQTVSVVATNKYEEHEGSFTVRKEIIADEKLLDGLELPSFDMTVTISGTFEMDGQSVVDSTRVINISLKGGETYTSPTIKWWGDNVPTVTVTENNIPKGWKNVSISNNGAEISDNLEIVVSNRLETLTVIDLTIKLAGDVWEDTPLDENDKNTENSVENGIMDDNERRLDGIEVYIYDNNGNLATIYDDGEEISQPIITTDGGHWEAPSVKILKSGTYDIEFVYDGQTYEPTKFLATSNGDANAYRSASTSGRDAWARDSMALDYNREEVDNRIQEIKGKTEINGEGETIGTAVGSEGEKDIFYEGAKSAVANGTSRISSEVQTQNADGTAKDLFKTKARTSVGGLTYPFDNRIHLESYDTYISELGLVQYYMYSATYNYTLHINLGLKRRPEVDLGTTKDLVSAKVVVNDKLLNYKFNKLEDIGSDCYSRQLYADTTQIEYQLGLYSTDYYYRAEMYQANSNITGYDAIEKFYKDLGTSIDATELDVYLTYKISLYNEGPDYITKINSVDDYFDNSFGDPINTKVEKYVKTIDGAEQNGLTEVANASYVESPSGNKNVTWNVTERGIKGSDGVTYNKMTAQNLDISLRSGEKADIYVTFALDKENIDGVEDTIRLGDKSNVAEISSYSTSYTDGRNAGKIDRDSAPANVNIRSYNEKSWYEDDTDSAPVLELTIVEENREINGLAWEDKPEEDTAVGNGLYDEGDEALIGGLTTELVEKIKVGDREYDFLWPTSKQLDVLGGKTLEYLTGFDSTTETSRENIENESSVGSYKFTSVPVGDYVVRFLYGNNKLDLEDTFEISGNPEAYKANGERFDEDNILTANYDKDLEGKTAAIYNGQDYRSTIYQSGFTSVDDNGYVNNEWHDLDNIDLANARVSDAKDSEARRLEITSNSETITNVNGTVLATANKLDEKHTDLYNDYSMFADTAKISLFIENFGEGVEEKSEILGTVLEAGSVRVQKEGTNYLINNIDFGLIERPETAVVLDKQISSIKLTTNDGNVIFNAIYDINYRETDLLEGVSDKTIITKLGNKYLIADVSLSDSSVATDVMQAINKCEEKPTDREISGMQNFRYVNIDETILQGTTIEINYQVSALNVGEVDRTSEILENISEQNFTKVEELTGIKPRTEKEALKLLANKAYEDTAKGISKAGEYLGTTYYTNDVRADKVVTTRVRQIVDYVDNDGIFSAELNNAKDHSWKNTNVTELTGSGYGSDKLLSDVITTEYELIDKKGIAYITDQRNNVILSIDTQENTDQMNNSGFEAKLVPYKENADAYKSQIVLTITKTVSAEDDANNLNYDNIAEIVKIENSVGRRDIVAVPGNANPTLGEFEVALKERDSSATELVTFTPPTGINSGTVMTIQILAAVVVALAVIAIGIVVIKKKVLK